MLGRRASRLAPQPAPYRHYARENRPRITLRRDGDIAPYRHYTRKIRTRNIRTRITPDHETRALPGRRDGRPPGPPGPHVMKKGARRSADSF